MKFKTVKDISGLMDVERGIHWVDATKLRQEAIKRAKFFKKKRDSDKERFDYWEGRYQETMDFNNLTEENKK